MSAVGSSDVVRDGVFHHTGGAGQLHGAGPRGRNGQARGGGCPHLSFGTAANRRPGLSAPRSEWLLRAMMAAPSS